MVETIGRGSHGGKHGTTLASCITFTIGALAGGAFTFGLLASLGSLVHGLAGGTAAGVAAAIAVVAALGEARGVRIRPQIRRQVPERWRRVLPLPVAAALYGVLLGLGFTTFIMTLGVWALALISFALGDAQLGLVMGLAFGAGRALPVALLAPLQGRRAGMRMGVLMAERPAILGGFRLADAAALTLCAVLLMSTDAFAQSGIPGATDPTAAGALLAWDAADGGRLRAGAEVTRLPGRDPALGGNLLAWREGDLVRIARLGDGAPVLGLTLPGVTSLAVSDGWLVYRQSGPDGSERLSARSLASPDEERSIAAVTPPAQIGRPALDGDLLVFGVAERRSSRIDEVDLASGAVRTLRSGRFAQVTNPAILGDTLAHVRSTASSQALLVGAREPGARDRAVYRVRSTARRDGDRAHGRRPRPGRRVLWTTALAPDSVYVTRLPLSGAIAGATIVGIRR